jgi:phosphatidylinositol alpha-mannosyltransferase
VRIALVCPYDLRRPGGVQQVVLDLAARLRAEGDDAWVVGPGAPDEWGEDVGRTVTLRGNASRVPLAVDPRSILRVRRAVSGAEVVHVHEPFAPPVSPAALRAGVPVVATFHAQPPPWVGRLYRGASRVGSSLLSGVVLTAVSGVAAAFLPETWGPVEIVPNGVDVAGFRPRGRRQPHRVAFLGRDEPRKGLDVLLDAWTEVVHRHPAAELVVIGATRPDPPERVTYLGVVDEEHKRSALGSAAVFVAPNRGAESFGLVLVEAMASGCAVVASDLPAFRAVAGDAARLVPPDEPGVLAEAIVALLDRPSVRGRLAAAGGRRAQAFDWPAVVEQYRGCYRQALSVG